LIQLHIPLNILSDRSLAPLEAISLHLKDQGYTNHQIAEAVGRDDRTIWTVLSRATKKKQTSSKQILSVSNIEIDVSIFQDRSVSALELISAYLQQQGLTLHEIAELLNRDDRTIWTSYHRYKQKKGEADG